MSIIQKIKDLFSKPDMIKYRSVRITEDYIPTSHKRPHHKEKWGSKR